VVIDPLGQVVAGLAPGEEGLVLADVSAEEVNAVRSQFPFLADRRF